MLQIPNLTLISLTFRATSDIHNLPHFHGGQWNAFFRNVFADYLPCGTKIADANVGIVTVDSGINHYKKEDLIEVGLNFPSKYNKEVHKALSNIKRSAAFRGYFQPEETVKLESVICRISGKKWNLSDKYSLKAEHIIPEIKKILGLTSFEIYFYSPLRLSLENRLKRDGHSYFDDYFVSEKDPLINPISYLLKRIRIFPSVLTSEEFGYYEKLVLNKKAFNNTYIKNGERYFFRGNKTEKNTVWSDLLQAGYDKDIGNNKNLKIEQSGLTWVDATYTNRSDKTYDIKNFGGVVGKVAVKGRLNKKEAINLVLGQYAGAGKSESFGLGYYTIPELQDAAVIKPLIRHKTLFLSTFTTHSLTNALNRLEDNSASGKDGITVKKFKQKGAKWIEKISKEISPDYETKEIKRAYIPKKDNEKEYREIILYNLGDRVIHKAIALQINDTIERILSTISFAYRRGLDSKKALRSLQKEMEEGYNIAVKADIDDFFGSINCKTLVFLLEGLFPFEPLVRLINKILSDSHKLGINGISQGSPLSPILSNIYLDRFDRVVTDAGLRMIRYCDDFVVLLAKDSDEKEGIKKIEKFLERFELKLKREKIEITKSGGVINFLGHTVSNKVLKLKEKEPDTFLSLWNNGFQENWAEGSPIYLTTNCRGVFSNGAHLVVKTLGGENNNFCEKKVIWNNVSRITVIGRANYSGGVIQRAVKENIPITFIDIMGVVRGHIYPARYFFNDLERIQEKYATNEKASLEFAKRFIFGKVYNSNMVLKKYGINRKEFTESLEKIDKCEDMDSLRGYEGYAASIFFEELPKLIYPFEFEKRVYHPPEGEVNVMLSFGYTLLYNRIVAALKVAGFNERIGFFHQQHGRHACLASDLIEELRFVIDHFTISMIQKRLLEKKHFTDEQINKKRLWRLTGEGFRVYIKNFESTMNKNITYDGKKLSIYSYLDEMIENLKFALRMETQYEPLLVEKDDLHSSL